MERVATILLVVQGAIVVFAVIGTLYWVLLSPEEAREAGVLRPSDTESDHSHDTAQKGSAES